MKLFTDFTLSPAMQAALAEQGFTNPTPIQEKAIPALLESKTDIHAQAATGTGKTLAFGIPLIESIDPKNKAVQALVLAPTRELVRQTYESLMPLAHAMNVKIAPIYGGMPIDRQIMAIKQGAQIVIGTPGRLNDHLQRKTLKLKDLTILVLDEADIMLDMGFKEEVDTILEQAPEDRSIWLFSATVRSGIKKLMASHMHDVKTVKTETKQRASEQVEQYYCIAPMRNRAAITARFIEAAPDFYGIIFCRTKMLTQELMEELASKGFAINCLHGDMKQTVRNKIIKGFKQKDFSILVATDVAARGIDVADLTHVINYSIPEDKESYVHRIGRTGRAGKTGTAITLIAPSERYRIKQIEKIAGSKLQELNVPTVESIIGIKIAAAADFVEQAKKPSTDNLSIVRTSLQKLLDSFSEQEVRNALVAGLENRFFKDLAHDEIVIDNDIERNAPMGKEICVELGSDNDITKDMVREFLLTSCNLTPQEIYKIRVLNKRTFISLPAQHVKTCLTVFKNKKINKQKGRVFISDDQRRDSSRRRSSDRGDRGRRPSSHHQFEKRTDKKRMRRRPKRK